MFLVQCYSDPYYNFTSNQFTGIHALVVPGTIRDSLFILEGLLEQQTGLRPHEVMSDTAGYSDLVFGLFWLMGYQFSPRLADFGEARFWRIDPEADYGALDGLARQRINIPRIGLHKDPANTIAAICATLGISRATFYRHLASPAEGTGVDGHRGESLRAARRSVKRSRPGRPRANGAK